MKSKKIYLYIDGTNLFAGQNDIFGPKRVLSFSFLVSQIKKKYQINKILFYASFTPHKPKRRPTRFYTAEALFYQEVRQFPKLNFYKGHRSPTSGKEKGVDTHLAVDMVKDGFLGLYDEAIIMTGDADLIYPVEIVRSSLKRPVHAVFLPNRFSLELAFKVNTALVFDFNQKFKSFTRRLPDNLSVITIKSPTCKQVG